MIARLCLILIQFSLFQIYYGKHSYNTAILIAFLLGCFIGETTYFGYFRFKKYFKK